MNNTTSTLTATITEATALIEKHIQKHIGNMTIEQALNIIEHMQSIRDREAIYAQEKACKACKKKAQKHKN